MSRPEHERPMPHDLTRRGLMATTLITASYLIMGERLTLTPAQAAELKFTPEVLTPAEVSAIEAVAEQLVPGAARRVSPRIWTLNREPANNPCSLANISASMSRPKRTSIGHSPVTFRERCKPMRQPPQWSARFGVMPCLTGRAHLPATCSLCCAPTRWT